MKQALIVLILLLMMGVAAAELPPYYDCRDLGYVTIAKDQGDCGCCNAFSTIAMLESAILADGGAIYDLSEEDAKNCPFEAVTGTGGGCSGGNANMVINIFTQRGALLEKHSQYKPVDGACNYVDDPAIRVTDWHILSLSIVPHTSVLKQAIISHGPIFTSMDDGCLPRDYNGSYVITKKSNQWDGHAMLIVGWDDSRSCWIVKNSWGESWGDNGYGYVAYSSGQIGAFSSAITGYELYDPNVRTLYHDEAGYTKPIGYVYDRDYGWQMCFYNIGSESIESVEFWTTGPTDDVDLYVYDGYRLMYNVPGKELFKAENLQHSCAGYHSVDIPNTVRSTTGMVVVIAYFKNAASAKHRYSPLAIDAKGVLSPDTYIAQNIYPNYGCWKHPGMGHEEFDFKHIGDATMRLRVRSGDTSVSKVVIKAEGSTTIQKGETVSFESTCYNSGGGITYCGSVAWRCSDQSVGTITSDGVFTAEKMGQTTIAAVCSGRNSNSVVVTVSDKPEPEPTPTPTPVPTPITRYREDRTPLR